jgi:hypothetical protein
MELNGLGKSSSDLDLIVGGFDGVKTMRSEKKQVKIYQNQKKTEKFIESQVYQITQTSIKHFNKRRDSETLDNSMKLSQAPSNLSNPNRLTHHKSKPLKSFLPIVVSCRNPIYSSNNRFPFYFDPLIEAISLKMCYSKVFNDCFFSMKFAWSRTMRMYKISSELSFHLHEHL